MESDSNNNNANTNTEINWNNIIKQDTRSIDDADLGTVQGLFEPFVVTERGTINKEKFYIPKDLIEGYNNGEVLHFNITEQEAKDFCMKNTPPSEDEAKHIVQTITERRSIASKKEGKEERESKKAEKKMFVVAAKKKDDKQQMKKISKANRLSRLEVGEEEIAEKMKTAANDLKHIIISGAKVAKEKIKERQEIAAEKKADRDAEKISKMGDLATQFTNSFEDILSEIRTRTYAEQEEIYTGFLKLIEQQRGLLIARRDLATELKSSVQKPAVTRQRLSLVEKEQPKLSREPELPLPPPEPQLPEVITTFTNNTTTKKGLRTKPRIRNESQMKKSSAEKIITAEESSPLSSAAITTEPSYTEIPSAEIPTKKQKTNTIDEGDSTITKMKNKRSKGR
ncbi:MAG TPA: hypothetical protein VE619_10035 [Nitrososphaeraceae archaeon]|nr:hypothetical protein [Nitrososphaeraceae archaeon]